MTKKPLMKSTLITQTDLDNILKIKELVKEYPSSYLHSLTANNMELGSRVRALISESKLEKVIL